MARQSEKIQRVAEERDGARAEVARLKELLLDMRWHPVDGGLMAVPAGWQQRRDVALGRCTAARDGAAPPAPGA